MHPANATAGMPKRRRMRRIASLLFFIGTWQLVAWSGVVPAEHFPVPAVVLQALWGALASGELVRAELLTLSRALLGALGASLFALALALLTARYRLARRAFEPVAEMFRPLPPAALVPIAIFVFGLGWKLYAFILLFACFWPMYLNAAAALAAVSRVQMQTGASFGYAGWGLLLRVQLPAALPEILIGIRLAASIALIATIVCEMLAGRDGLGFFLSDAGFTLRIPDMFAGLLIAMLNGILMAALVNQVRVLLIGWHIGLTATNQR